MEGRWPYSTGTDESQNFKGTERAIFHEYRQVTGLQGKGERHLPRTQASQRATREGRGLSSTDTDEWQDYRGRKWAILHRHRRFTELQGKGEGHLPRVQTSHMTTREGRGSSCADTGESQNYRGREWVIFHRHIRFTGLQVKGEGHRLRTHDSRDYGGREIAIFHGHKLVPGLQGKGEGHSPQTQTIHRTIGERRRASSTDTDDSQDYKGREKATFILHYHSHLLTNI